MQSDDVGMDRFGRMIVEPEAEPPCECEGSPPSALLLTGGTWRAICSICERRPRMQLEDHALYRFEQILADD